jgi:2-amino-4-hydroxy-6-hydroxymethyldihydropteridine diphosphokinase
MQVWWPAYIGIGSNLAEPRSQVLRAMDRVGDIARVSLVLRSRLYGSHPLGPADQPDFVNAAAGVLTQLEPRKLLEELRAIERAFGRPDERTKWGPRVLDLDLLVYARARCDDRDLQLPHPGIAERNFVLYPLADIAPDLEVPGLGRVANLRQHVSAEGIWPLDGPAANAPASPRAIGSARPVRSRAP